MRRLEVRYRKSAASDLANIYFYLRDRGASPHGANAYVVRIRAACRRIGDAPEGGTLRNDLLSDLRTWSFERRAVIAYRIDGRFVRIVKVFYGGQDIEAFFARWKRQNNKP